MVSRQLELGLLNQPPRKPAGRRLRRSKRARWWFDQMREVVSHARDWPPATMPTEASRQISAQPDPGSPPRETLPRPSDPAPLLPRADAPPSEPHRWRFSRSRHLIWE